MNVSYYEKNLIDILELISLYLYKYVLTIIYIIGNLGNLLSFFVFSKKFWRKNVCVFYFKFSLLFNSCYLNSTVLGIILINGFNIKLYNSSVILCKLYYYSCFLFAILPPTILILASIDRLLISSQNIDTRLYSSKRLAYFSISITTIFWVIFNLHALIMIDIHEISSNISVCSFSLPKVYYNFVSYFLGGLNVFFCLLMIILCILSFKNIKKIRIFPLHRHHGIRSMTKKDFQLLRCLFVQDIIFIIFTSISVTYYVYEALTIQQIQTKFENVLKDFLNKFVTFLFNSSYSCNFLIFFIISKSFRHEVKRICRLTTSQVNRDGENDAAIVVKTIELPE